MKAKLTIQPITLKEARRYVDLNHRHHRAPQGGLFAIAVNDGVDLRGVIIVGRPVARNLQDGTTAEVTRCCTDGAHNAPSMLYAAAWRAARAMGYQRLITYTLIEEPGTSLKAAGWKELYKTKEQTWDRPSRKRVDMHPTGQKTLWAMSA